MSALSTWKKKLAARKAALEKARQTVTTRQKRVRGARRVVRMIRRRNKAVAWALSKAGVTEQPPGSNRGPEISVWQRRWLGYDGYAWCGAFVGYALDQAGVTGLHGPSIVYTPSILADAQAGRNGLEKLVPLEQARKGDLILMDFAPGGAPVMHVGMARDHYKGGGTIKTIEGNTSSSNAGDQSNGGGVFRRERPRSVIVGVARPRWLG